MVCPTDNQDTKTPFFTRYIGNTLKKEKQKGLVGAHRAEEDSPGRSGEAE